MRSESRKKLKPGPVSVRRGPPGTYSPGRHESVSQERCAEHARSVGRKTEGTVGHPVAVTTVYPNENLPLRRVVEATSPATALEGSPLARSQEEPPRAPPQGPFSYDYQALKIGYGFFPYETP